MKFDPQKLIAFENNFSLPIAGIDEVGRGPLAGPVIAAAVILDRKNIPKGINDSKKIPKAKRILLAEKIKESSIYAYGAASEIEIDEINILQASLLAMKRASDGLSVVPKTTLIDGNFKPDIKNNTISIIKGDSKSVSIAAASILAKVYRDEIMLKYSTNEKLTKFEKTRSKPKFQNFKKNKFSNLLIQNSKFQHEFQRQGPW